MKLKDAFVYTRARIHVCREQIDSFLLCPLFYLLSTVIFLDYIFPIVIIFNENHFGVTFCHFGIDVWTFCSAFALYSWHVKTSYDKLVPTVLILIGVPI